jgi:hypothetical protein
MSTAPCIVAIILAVLAFGLYAAQVVCQLVRPATPVNDFLNQLKVVTTTAGSSDTAATAASIPDITALITALGTLVDSLVKAGPTLTSLIASIFFMAIAVGAYVIK